MRFRPTIAQKFAPTSKTSDGEQGMKSMGDIDMPFDSDAPDENEDYGSNVDQVDLSELFKPE